MLGCCTLLSGLLSASTALATNLETLCVLRFLLGLAEAGFYPGALLYVSLTVPLELGFEWTAKRLHVWWWCNWFVDIFFRTTLDYSTRP